MWGRDELGAGEMWNSNSLTSWLIARSGLPAESIQPARGRACAGLACRSRGGPPPGVTFRLRCVRGPAYTPSAMPIYEFVCMECESHFEELVGMNAADPACPDCGASKVARQLSVFAAHGLAPPGSRSSPAAGGGGGCCGGSCGCGA